MNKKAREKEFRRVMTRRSLLLGGMQLGIASFLGLRLYQLQVAQNSRYSRLSDRNQFDVKIVAPQRGRGEAHTGGAHAEFEQRPAAAGAAAEGGGGLRPLARRRRVENPRPPPLPKRPFSQPEGGGRSACRSGPTPARTAHPMSPECEN